MKDSSPESVLFCHLVAGPGITPLRSGSPKASLTTGKSLVGSPVPSLVNYKEKRKRVCILLFIIINGTKLSQERLLQDLAVSAPLFLR